MIPASVSDVPDGGPRAQVGGVDGEMDADPGLIAQAGFAAKGH